MGIAMWRSGYGQPWSSHIMRLNADNWKDVNTYKVNHTDVWTLPPGAAEDPFLYQDSNGNFHAITHHMVQSDGCWGPNKTMGGCLGHAFSKDANKWTYTG